MQEMYNSIYCLFCFSPFLTEISDQVSYCVDGFVDKNKDLLFNDLIGLALQTRSTFLPQLFPEAGNMDDKRRPSTAGFKIKVFLSPFPNPNRVL